MRSFGPPWVRIPPLPLPTTARAGAAGRLAFVGALALLAALPACGDDGGSGVDGVEVPDGYDVEEVVTGLRQPTQFVVADDGTALVAQLNGDEGAGTGQVVRVDLDGGGEPTVVFDGLRKPTGVELLGDEVWVMEERRLSRGPLVGGELTVVLDDLAFNGRSEGTLTATPDGRLLYETSGSVDGNVPVDGSASVWALTPGGEPAVLATGFKNAYGRTFDSDGTLWQTEVADGTYDGEQPPDELVAVAAGDDFGWPQCIGDGDPIADYGGTPERCASTPPSHVLFDAGATPTSVAVAPWDPDVLLVALWNEGRIVSVPRAAGDDGPVEATDFLTGLEHPQHLVADGERLLVGDFDGGRILAVTAAG